MSGYNIGSVAIAAGSYIPNINSTVSGNLTLFASGAILHLQNWSNEGISNPIPEKYEQVAVWITAMLALGATTNTGVNFNYSVGEVNVSKGANSTPDYTQLKALESLVNSSLIGISRKLTYYKAIG